MINSIVIAETGLKGYEQALQTISNNTANMNTPGFRSSTSTFADLAAGTSSEAGSDGADFGQPGYGLRMLGTTMDFSAGQMETTSNPLDLAVNGQGYFTTQDDKGQVHYTKDGGFKFDDSGALVSTTSGEKVLGLDGNGGLAPISIAGLGVSPPKVTTKVSFAGILSSSQASDTVSGINVIDGAGTSHALSAKFTPVSGLSGSWTVTLLDGSTTVGTATLAFSPSGSPTGTTALSFTYTPTNGAAMPLTLDFSSGVSSFDVGTSSTLAVSSQDGHALGNLTSETFDDTGTLVLKYSNSQTVKSQQLALAQFDSVDQVAVAGNNAFKAAGGTPWHVGTAGTGIFGSVTSSEIEGSNVDLSREFSNLVIMQRGYQACSEVVSTASDMLTALFGMMPK
jgi:flagellar hook protein FlgE